MTPEEFVIWLRGFTEGCNSYAATPEQWEKITETLEQVEDEIYEDIEQEIASGYTVYNYSKYWEFTVSV